MFIFSRFAQRENHHSPTPRQSRGLTDWVAADTLRRGSVARESPALTSRRPGCLSWREPCARLMPAGPEPWRGFGRPSALVSTGERYENATFGIPCFVDRRTVRAGVYRSRHRQGRRLRRAVLPQPQLLPVLRWGMLRPAAGTLLPRRVSSGLLRTGALLPAGSLLWGRGRWLFIQLWTRIWRRIRWRRRLPRRPRSILLSRGLRAIAA